MDQLFTVNYFDCILQDQVLLIIILCLYETILKHGHGKSSIIRCNLVYYPTKFLDFSSQPRQSVDPSTYVKIDVSYKFPTMYSKRTTLYQYKNNL